MKKYILTTAAFLSLCSNTLSASTEDPAFLDALTESTRESLALSNPTGGSPYSPYYNTDSPYSPYYDGTQGGYTGPSLGIKTVQEVLNAGMFSDGDPVLLMGYIKGSLGDDTYLFSDSTGSIHVEIDKDKWGGLQVTPQTRLAISGDIDKEPNGIKIDVDYIRLAE